MEEAFELSDCALISIAVGEKAYNLRELRDRLRFFDDKEIMYYHFWDMLLRPHFVDPEYQNDFAAWAYHELHDSRLAERLAIINPTRYARMDDLRNDVIETIEARMDEDDFSGVMDVRHPFEFMRSQIIVFNTNIFFDRPETLAKAIAGFSLSSIFYHFIDSRRRTVSGENDLTEWLLSWKDSYQELANEISTIDPYFNTLSELRDQLSFLFEKLLKKGGKHGGNA